MAHSQNPRRPKGRGTNHFHVEYAGSRDALVAGLNRGEEGAAVALFHEYAPLVERVLGRILGVDADLPDAVQDVFLRALKSVRGLKDPQALADWLLCITRRTASDVLRQRTRRRWMVLLPPEETIAPTTSMDEPGREALRATYRTLDRMGIEERTVFALRYIDGMELIQLASVCECSLATIKRRIQRASHRFRALAQNEPSLREWLERAEEGGE